MRWAEISVEATPSSADAVTEILITAGCGGTATNEYSGPTLVTGYLPVDDRLEARLVTIRERVRSLPGLGLELGSDEITVKWVEDDDWATAWKKYFKPIRFGRVIIKPSWERDTPVGGFSEPDTQGSGSENPPTTRREDVIVEIDPGMAFGTGNHPTTALCILTLQDYLAGGETVLDVGTGSGILAMTAAKLGAARVVGLDIDPLAVKIARENVANLGLDGIIDIREAGSPLAFEGVADLVVANIVPNVIMAMAEALREKVRPGGRVITSGIVHERADEVKAKLESVALVTLEERADGDWVAIISERGAG